MKTRRRTKPSVSRERTRFTVMHLAKLALLRKIIGAYPQAQLSAVERVMAGEVLESLDRTIGAHEERHGLKVVNE